MIKIRHHDGAAHISQLKHFDDSPAHYKVACETPYAATRAMRVGTGAHEIVLGARVGKTIAVFKGDRRQGTKWETFEDENRGREILTQPEWDESCAIAEAIGKDPVATTFLKGRREHALRWTDGEIECATDGIDVVGDGFLADLKITDDAKPARFMRTACNLFYHAQMAFYETGARLNGIDTSKGLFLVACESKAPFCVTVLRLPPPVVTQGRKSVAKWLELLQRCEENDHFPGYTQTVVDFEMPAWMGDDDGDA